MTRASRGAMRTAHDLTTTAYVILGVLAIRPRTAYELAAEVRHCFEYFWPRADVRVYAEAKALAAKGLADAALTYVGKRQRTTYTLTAEGRATLEGWLAKPAVPVALEFEALLKVYLARFGTREQLLATIEQVRDDATYMLSVARNVRKAYLEGCAPFQDEYVHIWAFVYDFLVDYFRLLQRWAARSAAEVSSWSDLDPAGKRERALRLFEAKRPPVARRAERQDGTALPLLDLGTDRIPALPGMWGQWRHHVLSVEHTTNGQLPDGEDSTS